MAEILKEWLSERLKKDVAWEAEEFGNLMKDGCILAGLLFSYNIITEDEKFIIRKTKVINELKDNWNFLVAYLRKLEIELSDRDVIGIIEGKSSILLRLFYQLFLYLDKRDRITFIKREMMYSSPLIEKEINRFNVSEVDEAAEKDPILEPYSKPLLQEKQFIEWQKKKEKEMKIRYDHVRSKFMKSLEEFKDSKIPFQRPKVVSDSQLAKEKKQQARDIEIFDRKYPCKPINRTYDELHKLAEKAEEGRSSIFDAEWASDYVKNLRKNISDKCANENLQNQMRNVLVGSIWDQITEEEEFKMDRELAKKVMKLSQFEKQMCTQLLETKQQARNIVANRVEAEKNFIAQRDAQFREYLEDLKDQLQREIVEIDFEQQRQNELHKKLWAEKVKRKKLEYYEMCSGTTSALIDYAMRYALMTETMGESDVPEIYTKEWKNLFFKNQPIFDILEHVEDLLQEEEIKGEGSDKSTEMEEIIHLEFERQNCLNEEDFYDYHYKRKDWSLEILIPNYNPDSEDYYVESLGLRILGYIVFHMLCIKYPLPPPRLPVDLPMYNSAVILLGLPDRSVIIPMARLLEHKKIHVVRMETAINYALKQYKLEMIGIEEVDLSFTATTFQIDKDKKVNPNKELIELIKNDDEPIEGDSLYINKSQILLPNIKQTQTPKVLPEEDMTFSPAADLGKYAYIALSEGEPLTDYLLSAIVIEYLKSLEGIKGFVLLNFPNSYDKAKILEELLSGKEMPKRFLDEATDDEYIEPAISRRTMKDKDPFLEQRQSKLVADPTFSDEDLPYVSYFTAYLNLKETKNLLKEYFIWDLTEENSSALDRFYAEQGINYSIYFETVEKEVLALICKFIVGDFKLPEKTSDELFGDGVLEMLEFPSSDDKKNKAKFGKVLSSDADSKNSPKKKSKKDKTSNIKVKSEIINSSPKFVEVEEILSVSSMKIEEEEELVKEYVRAGEKDWIYADLPQPEFFIINLATVWETLERTYIKDFHTMLFSLRLQKNFLIPYARLIRDHMNVVITEPCLKQELVSAFQKEYNDFNDDWRYNNHARNEWYCRIEELQTVLYNICDERKKHMESERLRIIHENWTADELNSMANTFISCMQIELNRSVLTYQIINDFYMTMLKKMPLIDRLKSKELHKIVCEVGMGDTPKSKKSMEDKMVVQLRTVVQDLQIANDSFNEGNNPYNHILEENYKAGVKVVNELVENYQRIIDKEQIELNKVKDKETKPKSKDESNSGINSLEEAHLKINFQKVLEEWSAVIQGEACRLEIRLSMLLGKARQDIKTFNNYMSKIFTAIYYEINERYEREILSVDRLVKVLKLAVEKGKKIQETLIVQQDLFLIDESLLQYPTPEKPPLPPMGERDRSNEFKINQLVRLREKLKVLGPDGHLIERAFVFILQDFLLYGKEDYKGSMFPAEWKQMEPEQIPILVHEVFGNTDYPDWRDFLIFCLNIRFPNMDELLELRGRFRALDKCSEEVISRDMFMEETLWYEEDFDLRDPQDLIRMQLVKLFLCELFESAKNTFNYSAFLLAFCKSQDPKVGFAGALSLAINQKVCYSMEDCDAYVQEQVNQKIAREKLRAEAEEFVLKYLKQLVEDMFESVDGITITEVDNSGLPLVNFTNISSQNWNQNSTICPTVSTSSTYPSEQSSKTTDECLGEDDYKPFADPRLVYTVTEVVLRNILEVTMPWEFKMIPENDNTYFLDDTIVELKKETENGEIYVNRFLNSRFISGILSKIHKFRIADLVQIASELTKNITSESKTI